jgi:hypothetical protein
MREGAMRRVAMVWLGAGSFWLAGCGHHFPAGERLIPATYGPPFGSALHANQPHHPHNPAGSERHAEPDARQDRGYGSYPACRAALARELGARQPGSQAVDVSAREAVGHAVQAGIVHEYRCVGPTLSYRAWHQGGEGEEGHSRGSGEEGHPG